MERTAFIVAVFAIVTMLGSAPAEASNTAVRNITADDGTVILLRSRIANLAYYQPPSTGEVLMFSLRAWYDEPWQVHYSSLGGSLVVSDRLLGIDITRTCLPYSTPACINVVAAGVASLC